MVYQGPVCTQCHTHIAVITINGCRVCAMCLAMILIALTEIDYDAV